MNEELSFAAAVIIETAKRNPSGEVCCMIICTDEETGKQFEIACRERKEKE